MSSTQLPILGSGRGTACAQPAHALTCEVDLPSSTPKAVKNSPMPAGAMMAWSRKVFTIAVTGWPMALGKMNCRKSGGKKVEAQHSACDVMWVASAQAHTCTAGPKHIPGTLSAHAQHLCSDGLRAKQPCLHRVLRPQTPYTDHAGSCMRPGPYAVLSQGPAQEPCPGSQHCSCCKEVSAMQTHLVQEVEPVVTNG